MEIFVQQESSYLPVTQTFVKLHYHLPSSAYCSCSKGRRDGLSTPKLGKAGTELCTCPQNLSIRFWSQKERGRLSSVRTDFEVTFNKDKNAKPMVLSPQGALWRYISAEIHRELHWLRIQLPYRSPQD